MVMEPAPNAAIPMATGPRNIDPHFLGREFVRQYYTLLNESPQTLYRFYAEDSSLLHGSVNRMADVPVCGLQAIQNLILSLNLRDCRAKIRQVDSLETLGKGVVVQVSGELSNSGEPMRRFFQTFVLTPRSPTNYYVRNEIFRYQDEVFSDEDEVSEAEKASLELAAKSVLAASLSANQPDEAAKHLNGHPELHKQHVLTPEPAAGPEILHPAAQPAALSRPEPQHPPQTQLPPQPQPQTQPPPQIQAQPQLKSHPQQQQQSIQQHPQLQQQQQHQQQNHQQPAAATGSHSVGPGAKPPGAGSWASRLADSVGSSVPVQIAPQKLAPVEAPAPQTSPVTVPAVAAPITPLKGGKDARRANRGKGKIEKGESSPAGSAASVPAATAAPAAATNVAADNSEAMTDDKKPGVVLGDDHQVFVGNLPHDITEDELRRIFSKFGVIAEVRINRTNQKSSAGRTPNYGFVTFEEVKVVKTILSQKPIYFNEHRFNVEEKRSQARGQNNMNRSSSGPRINSEVRSMKPLRERKDGNRFTGDHRPVERSAPAAVNTATAADVGNNNNNNTNSNNNNINNRKGRDGRL